jgi:hypothetical protein
LQLKEPNVQDPEPRPTSDWRLQIPAWPAAGFVDTEKRCLMKLEVGYGEADI